MKIKDLFRYHLMVSIILKTAGILFLFIGLMGLILPVIPGIVFLILGILILGEDFILSRWILSKMPASWRTKFQKKKE